MLHIRLLGELEVSVVNLRELVLSDNLPTAVPAPMQRAVCRLRCLCAAVAQVNKTLQWG